ncbi:ABC transporter ATP-binding protein [Desulfosporosinus lacus]|uniref:NitT/TauT family transport system ATP-binding protein n=1 Tax=Desulfosporosinus lacus DSM 15449 TaxID=1121420 RepID=A0A1M5ZQN6_9FIRM|nr:ABC transporter ATP-binding protein [Desulfosporosinus lacus]SHI26514.1 NitT/TauT family transport system ATP-binding protein [Desulfosporosinus lacus DSM 15449]
MTSIINLQSKSENKIKLALKNITVTFSSSNGHQVLAVNDVSLDVYEQEFIALIGTSGCGKSTLLNVMAGLITADSGQVLIDGVETVGINPKIGYMSQLDSLLPWATVMDNVALGLELRGISKKERRAMARELIVRMGLTGFEYSYPHELSGGMKKRVTIARVLAIDPEILFMDEPFGPLDAFTKEILQDDILKIWHETKKTIVYVTHDLSEAISLADRVVLISSRPGKVKAEYNIPLPRPRNVMDIKFDANYVDIEKTIWLQLKEEVIKGKEGIGHVSKIS